MCVEKKVIDCSSLHEYSLFGGLLPEDICKISHWFDYERYDAHTTIQTANTANDRIRFVLSGTARITRDGVHLNDVLEGEFFGEVEILGVMMTAATIEALTPLSMLTLSNRALYEIYKLDPKIFSLIIMNMGRDLARRLRRMNDLYCAREPAPIALSVG